MIPAFVDFETYWDQEHTLSKMSPIAYVMSPKTEIISMSIKWGDRPTEVVFGEAKIGAALRQFDMSQAMLVAHNMSGFDAMICAWRFGLRPRIWGCTLAMARPLHAKTVGLSLAKLVAHYQLGVKDAAVLHQTRGKRLADFTPDELQAMKKYNQEDTDQCAALFYKLLPHYSAAELFHLDCNIRMLVEPRFELDVPLLEAAASVERGNKLRALLDLARLMKNPEDDWGDEASIAANVMQQMQSAAKFGEVLKSCGVEVPTKPSPSDPSKTIPAIAKTDEAMTALLEHENEIVAAAARARLAAKSTLLESRIAAFLEAAEATGGRLPVPVNYCGADTTGRDSGWAYNCQNLPRIVHGKPKVSDVLRNSMRAPKGFLIGVADQSGIELRINHFLWKVPSSMALYQASPDKADLYRAFASEHLYHVDPWEVTKEQRQVGKLSQLGLGFGAGAATFQRIARLGGAALPLEADDENTMTATKVVDTWRAAYAPIVAGWRTCGGVLQDIVKGVKAPVDPWGLIETCAEGLRLPSGRLIRYPNLRFVDEGETWPDGRSKRSWVYAEGRHKAYLTGPKVVENCVAGGTLVLTGRGWVPVESVADDDTVHDGVEFVRHGGCVSRNVQPCVRVDGVYMTPDHEVLTDDGWVQAGSSPRPYRPDLRDAYGDVPSRAGRSAAPYDVAFPLRVRRDNVKAGCEGHTGSATWGHPQLWVRDRNAHAQGPIDARHDNAPGIRGLALHERSVSSAITRGIQELRRTWDSCVRGLEHFVRGILVGHGGFIPAGPGPGPGGQRRPVLSGELPVGDPSHQHDEQAQHDPRRGRARVESSNGDKPKHAVLPAEEWVALGTLGDDASTDQPVFDIMNCGPRHRFVVLGDSGPFVVHNCVQALARDSVFECALRFLHTTRLRPVMRVHDELIYMFPAPEAEALLQELQSIMRTPPSWWPELVVWSEGDVAETYGAAK